jgi:hypothetical protein
MNVDKVWMQPPDGGHAKEVPATPEALTPLMAQGWTQAEPPSVHDSPAATPTAVHHE